MDSRPRAFEVNTSALNRLLVARHTVTERRQGERTEFEFKLRLEPVGVGADSPVEGVIVKGKDISAAGVSIVHDHPLPFRKVRLTAADPTLDAIGLVDFEINAVLRWCRFLGPGRYESGGTLLPTTDDRRVA